MQMNHVTAEHCGRPRSSGPGRVLPDRMSVLMIGVRDARVVGNRRMVMMGSLAARVAVTDRGWHDSPGQRQS